MDQPSTPPETAVATCARRVREVRHRRGWTAEQLADRIKAVGGVWERTTIVKFEAGRRLALSVDELYVLAMALDVAPVALLVPLDNRPVRLTSARVEDANDVRAWVRGEEPLPGVDEQFFRTEVSVDDLRREVLGEPAPVDQRVQKVVELTDKPVSEVLRLIADAFDGR